MMMAMGRPSLWDDPDPEGKLPLDAPDHKAIDPTSTLTIDHSFALHEARRQATQHATQP